jgi:hypothetical protein
MRVEDQKLVHVSPLDKGTIEIIDILNYIASYRSDLQTKK